MSEIQVPFPENPIPEKYYTVKEAAELLGILEWKLNEAVKRKLIPHYTFMNSRKYVLLSEVQAAINASRQGGDDE